MPVLRPVTRAAALGAALLALGGCSLGPGEPERDGETGEIVEASEAGVLTITVGDCLDAASLGEEVETVATIPCGEPHDSEIFAATLLPDGDYPGDDVVWEEAVDYCLPEFDRFVGVAFEESELDVFPLYPTEGSWNLADDREVLCIVVAPEPVTGTLRGAAR